MYIINRTAAEVKTLCTVSVHTTAFSPPLNKIKIFVIYTHLYNF